MQAEIIVLYKTEERPQISPYAEFGETYEHEFDATELAEILNRKLKVLFSDHKTVIKFITQSEFDNKITYTIWYTV